MAKHNSMFDPLLPKDSLGRVFRQNSTGHIPDYTELNRGDQSLGQSNLTFSMIEETSYTSDGRQRTVSNASVVVPWWIMEKNDSDRGSCSKNSTSDSNSGLHVSIHRDVMNQEELHKNCGKLHHHELPVTRKIKKRLRKSCLCSPWSLLMSLFPIIQWLPKYSVKDYLFNDVVAGFTISIMHIPQGLAYGVLATASPINGLYVSAFPCLIYLLMGTSKHISVGTFAVVSLLLSSATDKLGAIIPGEGCDMINLNCSGNASSPCAAVNGWPPTSMEVLTTLALMVGTFQILMGLLHLGILSIFMSDPMISGFTTGAAVQVAISLMKTIFDVPVPRYSGAMKSIYTLIDTFKNLGLTNYMTLVISFIAIVICAVVHEHVNTRFKHKLKVPVPVDLVVMIGATVISYFTSLHENFAVDVMGKIPTGIPNPALPRLDLVPYLLTDAVIVSMVAFTIALSMAKLFSKRHKYSIDPNQELIALGASNIFGCFFDCFPCAVSLSRSSVQEKVGGKTQVASFVSSCLLIVVMLAVGPLFGPLPKCILSAVILVALKGMFWQIQELFSIWKLSRLDALTWLFTFLSVVLLDIDFGIAIGIGFSVVTVALRTLVPYHTFLGHVPDTDIYLDVKKFSKAEEIPHVKIFYFSSALYFANREVYKDKLLEGIFNGRSGGEEEKMGNYSHVQYLRNEITHLVIDCSAWVYVDTSGLETLREIMAELKEASITVYFAACTVPVYKLLKVSGILKNYGMIKVFPTIHDAVLHCRASCV